ncbi:hypothetical protein GCM10009827_097160 [Dactylosporangium maewongense]|uniref:Uncharacterized protein n=1 Tax=Dactylosporangium maewongense TaxID=634393 RepID=A0ABP4NHK0_9ACTN
MSAGPAVFVGDLLRAMQRLRPDPAAAEAIAELLGLRGIAPAARPRQSATPAPAARTSVGGAEPVRQPRPPGVAESIDLARAMAPLPAPPAAAGAAEVSPRPVQAQALTARPAQPRREGDRVKATLTIGPVLGAALLRTAAVDRLEPAGPVDLPTAPWPRQVEPLDPPEQDLPPPALPDSLFPAVRARALLTAALGVGHPDGPPDIPAMVDALIRGRLVDQVRRRRLNLRLGAEVLVDASAAMTPFALDAVVLRGQIEGLLGPRVRFLRFVGCPVGGAGTGTGPRPWPAYRAPLLPTRILVVSDIGAAPADLATPVAAWRWIAFAAAIRARGCPLLTLTPYPLERIPPDLRQLLNVVPWRETTTVHTVAQIAGRR